MHAINTIDHPRAAPPDSCDDAAKLIRQLQLAQGINACARVLLQSLVENDSIAVALAHLQNATAMQWVALFQKKVALEDEIIFDWLTPAISLDTSADFRAARSDRATFSPSAETAARLSEGQPVPLAISESDANERACFESGQVHSGLILPIMVFGCWWGGVCLGSADKDFPWCERDTHTISMVADLFGVFFERQTVSREDAQSDKLAGALEMAGTVCHKLNQPMQVILGYASMVTSGDISEPDHVREIVQTIEDETRRMGIITKNLMGITKYRTVETPDVGAICDIENQTGLS